MSRLCRQELDQGRCSYALGPAGAFAAIGHEQEEPGESVLGERGSRKKGWVFVCVLQEGTALET
jgi:hypothetical protein